MGISGAIVRLVAASLGVAGAGIAAAQEYRLVDLGPLLPRGRMATTADGRLLIPGIALDGVTPTLGIYTKKGVQFRTYRASPNRMWAYTTGVNRSGDISGWDWGIDKMFALVWRANGRVVILGSQMAQARAINDHRTVVGSAAGANGAETAPTVWFSGGRAISVTSSPYTTGVARDVNNRDEVVGYLASAANTLTNVFHAFKWSESGGIRWLLVPNGTASGVANSINEAGVAVGRMFFSGNGSATALLWDPDGTCHVLAEGGEYCQASAINNHNAVVGERQVKFARVGWLWTKENGLVALSSLVKLPKGWELQSPRAIDDAGDIAGAGLYQGVRRGFLLIPIKAPETPKPQPAEAPPIKP